jgi:regulator of sirC expression with transglutaminase-like and TPR domain
VTDEFATLGRTPDSDIDLLQGALLIAREEYSQLDVAACIARVEELARRLGRRPTLDRLNDYFFRTLGFRGNRDDYYDPRNSYVNDVLERRTGIPITLALLFCEIGRRVGLETAGVGFPGHFLARCGSRFVDCFHGRTLDRDGCRDLLATLSAGRLRFEAGMLADSPPRDVLARMLNNLRAVYAQRADWPRVLRFSEMAVELQPDRAETVRDRGMAFLHIESFGRAVGDLEEYLRRAPDASDTDDVREHLSLARKLLARVN